MSLSASALNTLGGWLGKKIFDETWDAGKRRLRTQRLRGQWSAALQSAANHVRAKYPEVAVELFDDHFLSEMLVPRSEALLQTPTAVADMRAVAHDFRDHFRALNKGTTLPSAQSPLLRRADGDTEAAIALFFQALDSELAAHSELRPAWRDRTLADIQRNVQNLQTLASGLPIGSIHADQALKREISNALARRHFPGRFDRNEIIALAQAIISGEYAAASPPEKATALRLCCRLTVNTDIDTASGYLAEARKYSTAPTPVEDAWIEFASGQTDHALRAVRDGEGANWQSATFAMLRLKDGVAAAAEWFSNRQINLADWTGPQATGVVFCFVQANRWDDVDRYLQALTSEHFAKSAALHLISAAAAARKIAIPGSDEYLFGAILPLSPHALISQSRSDWLSLATAAVDSYEKAAAGARALDLADDARRFEELALWISFETPSLRSTAEHKVRLAFQDRSIALDVVPFAAAHGVDLPKDRLRALLKEREAVGGLSATDVRAAIVLCDTDAEVLDLIERRRTDIEAVLGVSTARYMEVQATLASKGMDAAFRLLAASAKDLDTGDAARLRAVMATADDDKRRALSDLFETSRNAMDLRNLANYLANVEQWSAAADRFSQLFTLTKLTSDAERLCLALAHADRLGDLPNFFDAHWTEVEPTRLLRSYRAMALARQGKLKQARELIEALLADGAGVREEQIYSNILIETGDWDGLATLVERIWQHRADRPADHLVWAARAAAILDLGSRALDLSREAASRNDAGADVFATAAHIVFEIGREEETQETSHWFQRAVSLSGEDGPIQQMDISSLIDRMPEWRQRETNTTAALYSGQMPLFIAARGIGTSLGDIILGNALRSQASIDGRRRPAVPTTFGARAPGPIGVSGRVALDISSVLVLESIGLLGKVLSSKLELVLPSGTMNALFLERQKARFHQPSQIAHAEKLLAFVAKRQIQAAPLQQVPGELSTAVGRQLAQLISAARAANGLLVRPPPITRPGDFSETSADLSSFSEILTDTRTVLRLLIQQNRLSDLVRLRAITFIHRHDSGWPNAAEVTSKPLFLDGLALSYMQSVGLLEPLTRAGLPIYVHQDEIDEAVGLVEHQTTLQGYFDRLESARTLLRDAIAADRIAIAPQYRSGDDEELEIHPTMQLLQIENADWVVVDDRALNVHARTTPSETKAVPIATSLDLIHLLQQEQLIDADEARLGRHRMRESGFFFVPVHPDEFLAELNAASVRDDVVEETRFLRIAREAPLRLATIDGLNLQKEGAAFDLAYRGAILALFRTWRSGAAPTVARAQADWLLIHIQGLGTLADAKGGGVRAEGLGPLIAPLLLPPFGEGDDMMTAYEAWVEESLWPALRARNGLSEAAVKHFRDLLRQYMSDDDDDAE